jgi:hypothetical protein
MLVWIKACVCVYVDKCWVCGLRGVCESVCVCVWTCVGCVDCRRSAGAWLFGWSFVAFALFHLCAVRLQLRPCPLKRSLKQ